MSLRPWTLPVNLGAESCFLLWALNAGREFVFQAIMLMGLRPSLQSYAHYGETWGKRADSRVISSGK